MNFSHRPFGSGHPYRHDLDQRVPPLPRHHEPFEIRVTTDPTAVSVVVDLDGTKVTAERVDPAGVEQEFGPFAAGVTEAGHLAAAAEGSNDPDDTMVWIATATVAQSGSYTITVGDGDDTVTSQPFDIDPLRWKHDGGQFDAGPDDARLDRSSIEWLTGEHGTHRVRFRLRIDPGQHVIGLGERYASLDHRGQVYDSIVFEQYKHQGHRTYLPVPMAVVVGGEHWGFHLRTSRRVWFDLAATDPDWIAIEAEVDPDQPALSVGLWDGDPASIVNRFLDETGRPPQPPDWVFEPWMSGNEWNSQQRVEQEVFRSIEEDIPVGAVVIEAWSDESTFVAFNDAQYEIHADGSPHQLDDFTFPADGRWPDPKAMVDRLHDAGCKVLLWQIPLLPTDRGDSGQIAADLETLEANNWAVKQADGSTYHNRAWWFPGALLPDFTNPDARRWWRDKRRYLLEEVGIDGFKTDGGEHLWGHDLTFADGTSGAETNNRFPVLYAQTYHELMTEAGVDGITFSRAGYTGSAAFPCHWAGDEDSTWEAFQASIRAGLNAGVVGIYYWSWDTAGFSGPVPDAELYLRATAMATFSPIMQYHSEFNHHQVPAVDRTPWNIAKRTGDTRVLDVYRLFAKLRMKLKPYLVEQSARSIATGKPIMRPLCFDYPDDPALWNYPLQYQLGDDLIVAPITTEGADEATIYLPAGEWIDCFTPSTTVETGEIRRHVALDEIAVFRRVDSSATISNVFETSAGDAT